MRAIVWKDSILIPAKADDAQVSSLPCARWLGMHGKFMFPLSLFMARRIEKKLGPMEWSGDAAGIDYIKEWSQRYELALRLRDAEELPGIPIERIAAWKHQKRGFWFAYHNPTPLLSEDMGTGKSKQYVNIVENRRHARTLVVTTASCVIDWPMHVDRHAVRRDFIVLPLDSGSSEKKAKMLRAAVAESITTSRPLLASVSWDSVWRKVLAEAIVDAAFAICFLDESHNMGDINSRRAKFLVGRLSKVIPYRVCGSGTAAKHKPEDLFAQFAFLDPGIVGYSYRVFCERYCVYNRPSDEELRRAVDRAIEDDEKAKLGGDPVKIFETDLALKAARAKLANMAGVPRFVVGYKNLDELHKIFRAVSFHCDADVLDLPEPIHVVRNCKLGDDARRAYDELENDFMTEIAGVEIPPAIAIVRLLRLQQITSGFVGEIVFDPETGEEMDRISHDVDDAKEKVLTEILSEISPDEPVVVAARFKHDLAKIRRVAEACGRKVYEQSGAKKEKLAFMAAAGGEVLAGQMKSACEGNDFTRARYLVIYSLGFSLYQYEQLLKRIDRPGQTRRPCFIHIIAEKTIDGDVYRALRAHREVIDEIINGYKSRTAAA